MANIAVTSPTPLQVNGGPVVLNHPPAMVSPLGHVSIGGNPVSPVAQNPITPPPKVAGVPKISGSGSSNGGCGCGGGCGGCGNSSNTDSSITAVAMTPSPSGGTASSGTGFHEGLVSRHDLILAATITVAILAALYLRKKVSL